MCRSRAISPVVATVIIVAITIALALVVSFWASGIASSEMGAKRIIHFTMYVNFRGGDLRRFDAIGISGMSAFDATVQAFQGNVRYIDYGPELGYFITDIGGVGQNDGVHGWGWWWALYVYDKSDGGWKDSQVGASFLILEDGDQIGWRLTSPSEPFFPPPSLFDP